jgi:hypothetical protein
MRWCLVFLMMSLPVGTAHAETNEADKAKARKLVKVAKRMLKQKRLARALRYFEQAHRYWDNPVIQYNIAVVHLALGDKVKAATHLRQYMKTATSDDQVRLPAALRKVLSQVAVMHIRAPASDLAIWVDDKLKGMGKVVVVVLPGERNVEFRRGEKVVFHKTVKVAGGQTFVYNPASTAHTQPPPITNTAKKLHWAYFVAAAGLAVVAGAVTIGTGMRTLALHDEFEKDPSDTDVQSQGKTMKATTNAMIGVTAAAAVAAGVLAFFTQWKKTEKPSALRFQPAVIPGGASVSLSVQF